jgi:hypothetical protein
MTITYEMLPPPDCDVCTYERGPCEEHRSLPRDKLSQLFGHITRGMVVRLHPLECPEWWNALGGLGRDRI